MKDTVKGVGERGKEGKCEAEKGREVNGEHKGASMCVFLNERGMQ